MSQDKISERFRQRIQAAKEQQLEELDLSNGQLTQIPDEVFELRNLKVLNLSWNKIHKLHNYSSNSSNLIALNLSNNQLPVLPDSIANFFNLTTLDLSNNQLVNLPNSLANLSNLTTLDLSNNQLSNLPDYLAYISNLTELYLSSNQLANLPNSIFNLSNLTILYLSNNQLDSLPDAFSTLSSLTVLDLSDNHLSSLPDSISTLSNLKELYLSGNSLEKPPLEVAEKGIKAIKEYLRQLREEGKDYIYEAKLLIVGEGGAGKTSLAKKIEDSNYQLDTKEKSTEGIDITKWSFTFLEKEQKEREFTVNIWDFGGQEIYHATHQFFLTKRSLYALVADTRKEDTDFYYWLNVVELLSNNSPLLIVKNEKGDRTIEIDVNSLRGRFENLKESLATNLKDNRGLNAILDSIKYHIAKLPHVGSALPKTWKRVRESLEQDKRNYISLEEYLQICQDNGFTQLKDKLQLSGYLHDLGVCLHFQDSPLLRNTVILKPEWGTDAVYKVLDDKQVINHLGKFTTKDLDKIWSDEQYLFKQAELLELMMRFKLCYQIPGTQDTYIAPQLLTKTKPIYEWYETDNLILRYTYEFMPKGIITQFIVVMHQHIYQQKYVWRSGVVLNKDNTQAEVIEYYERREIRIRVAGTNRRNFMTIITNELDKINNSYHRLTFQKLVPCNCSACINRVC
ncbi:MAG: COR domain-containing protein [Xenococcaceae cyanobacterium]